LSSTATKNAERDGRRPAGHIPRKRFGQHFLGDPFWVRRIVEAIAPRPGDLLVEIGPGLGALTEPLLETVDRLHVVEIDRDIVARLESSHPRERLVVHAGDALTFDFGSVGSNLRLVGNLPYNISTPLLFHVAAQVACVLDAHFMLQKEVVDRMVAEPGGSEYGRLSVMLQYRFAMEKLFDVPPGAFRPPPKVDSSVVRMIPYSQLPHPARDERLLGEVVTRAFTQRRKTLRNALSLYLTAAELEGLGIDPGGRPETLDVAAWVRAADCVAARAATPPSSG
jgi:16S rRNA (adenine1518-N6/adenine1519-N6)-dimethyltransferase